MVPDVSLLYILQLRETGNSHSVPPDNRGVHKSFAGETGRRLPAG